MNERVTNNDLLLWLQDWYAAQCDGDWEHEYGVRIDTLDNPGWHLKIDLAETEFATRPFDGIEWHRSDDEWLVCRLEGETFDAACRPHQLVDAIAAFRDWVSRD